MAWIELELILTLISKATTATLTNTGTKGQVPLPTVFRCCSPPNGQLPELCHARPNDSCGRCPNSTAPRRGH